MLLIPLRALQVRNLCCVRTSLDPVRAFGVKKIYGLKRGDQRGTNPNLRPGAESVNRTLVKLC